MKKKTIDATSALGHKAIIINNNGGQSAAAPIAARTQKTKKVGGRVGETPVCVTPSFFCPVYVRPWPSPSRLVHSTHTSRSTSTEEGSEWVV